MIGVYMTVVIEGKRSFFLADRAEIMNMDRDLAWAEKYVKPNPMYKYVLGRYAEADKANHNNQFWALNDLRLGQPSIQWSPMNILHQPQRPVGTFIATEMMYPTAEAAAAAGYDYQNPFIEALGVFWSYYFPNELKLVETAHASGSLFFSMECVSKTLTCDGDQGCGQEFAYAGPHSTTYCEHLQAGVSIKRMNEPHFLGGALILPPAKPGWSGAEVRDLSELVAEHQAEAEMAYEGIQQMAPDGDAEKWEYAMGMLLKQAFTDPDIARNFNADQRKKAAKSGAAMSDGSFPIENEQDLKNAIQAVGRAKNPDAAKAHIKSRAKALGLTKLLPEGW